MEKSAVLATLSLASFIAIFFTPSNTNYWVYTLIPGIIFGIWYLRKN